MNSKSKYSASTKPGRTDWPGTYEARQLKSFLGALGCGTSQLKTFEELHGLAKLVFGVAGDVDHRVTALQIDALGKRERRRRASEYVKTVGEPGPLWPAISRARGTLSGRDSKALAAAKVILGQREVSIASSESAYRWSTSLRPLQAWMVLKGVDPTVPYSEKEILELCWEIHQSSFTEVRRVSARPTSLPELQRRLTGEGKKYRVWDRLVTSTRDSRLGTFGPASDVRHILS